MSDARAGPIVPGSRVAAGDLRLDSAFVVFDQQDSGCVSYGVTVDGVDWFVKVATTPQATRSLARGLRLHAAVRHPAVVRPVAALRLPELALLYVWVSGRVLNHATRGGADRSALAAFRRLPTTVITAAIDVVLDAHREIARCGFVAVDFYDGCLMYDFDAHVMRLIDLDEYRPGPFVLDADRLPGSLRYMAPEELQRGAVIDQRTTVFGQGRMIHHLLDGPAGWRGTPEQARVVQRATRPVPSDRYAGIDELVAAWHQASGRT